MFLLFAAGGPLNYVYREENPERRPAATPRREHCRRLWVGECPYSDTHAALRRESHP
jgi:hypothetical protein